jgi:hypothetical protein
MKMMCLNAGREEAHPELGQSRLVRDASDVEKIVDALEGQYHNLFDLDTVILYPVH